MEQYTDARGIRHCVDPIPAGMVVVEEHTPNTSITPWDYHGLRHAREWKLVLSAKGIPSVVCVHRREGTRPIGSPGGSGPGGRVRLGDDMMPSTFRVCVSPSDEAAARAAWGAHREAVSAWLNSYGTPNELPRPSILAMI